MAAPVSENSGKVLVSLRRPGLFRHIDPDFCQDFVKWHDGTRSGPAVRSHLRG